MAKPTEEHEFTLTGRDGEEHRYTVTLHPTLEALRISNRLSCVIADPLWSLLMQSPDGEGDTVSGAHLRESLKELSPELIRKILENADRDDLPLHTEANLDEAYRGNLRELYQAVWKVVEVNDFLPFADTVGELLSEVNPQDLKAAMQSGDD